MTERFTASKVVTFVGSRDETLVDNRSWRNSPGESSSNIASEKKQTQHQKNNNRLGELSPSSDARWLATEGGALSEKGQ